MNGSLKRPDVSWRVGLLAPRAFHFYAHEVVSGMGSSRLELGQSLLPIDLLYRDEENIPGLLSDCQLDGLILGLDQGRYERYKKHLPDIPMVNIHPDQLSAEIPTIAIDPKGLAQATIAYFRSLGIKNLATISPSNTEAQRRIHQYMGEEMEGGGGQLEHFTVEMSGITTNYLNHHELPVIDKLDDWLAGLPHPTGLLSSGGFTAIMAVESARRIGLSIPNTLSVLSRSDDNVCLFADPPISSFRSVGKVIGELALSLLIQHFNGATLPTGELKLPVPSVVERLSTGVPAGTETSLAAAVHYIRRNAFKGITVEDVLAASPGLSRSSLYRGYENKFGNSPAQEITRLRIDEAKYLLRFSGKSLSEIAALCSFKNPAHFSTVFTREVGAPPGVWRKR